ncbi:hypothetical protein CAPTEDRAFT_206179 [Capitella teleta]|uniref:Uncharacterized protein n=1 Tax=Capitella teleta TaxID=283909 RepID=R7TBG4_CAPTE|nr:hypothetical protein CAPTEDRAFT_206179 [Capitella teleta]|eukprot:ELT91083.1 hypothetical protein CAPTEDRAFT_206179 [Capitella teleta]
MFDADFEFDDDLFGETRQRSKPALHSYNAKICGARWFDDEENAGDTEPAFFYKFRADLAYKDQDYQTALDNYIKSIAALSTNNTTVIRDVEEGICRCYYALGEQRLAEEAANRVWNISVNFEQKTSALNLIVALGLHFKQYKAALDSLIQLTLLHPANPELWLKLAFTYMHLTHASSSENIFPSIALLREPFQPLSHISISPKLVVCTCFARSKRLLRNVMRHVSSFVKEKNLKSQSQIDKYIEQLNLPAEQMERCYVWVNKQTTACKEDDEDKIVPNVQILDAPTEQIRADFETKWFSWFDE